MTDKLIGGLGTLTTILFIVGFVGLFILNPQTYEELNNLSISGYNLDGMNAENWIKTFYIIVGLLNIVIALGLFRISDNKSIIVGGKILLLVSGVIWTTFGLINYDPNTDFGNHLLAQRTIAILATGLLGLILIGAEMEKIRKDKFLKYFTLAAAGTMLLLSLLSVFVYWDETWIRTNISLTIYFVWFGVFGLRLVQKASAQHNVSAMVP
ncbi:MAG: hypothetical protein IM574_12430 [Cytophagales bacterium]|jgi:hypothetical protein|nr:hypothetical protein [Cytophagales bacterium]MCA6416098.1 hypothetical protein [Cytophagales bacterium]MCA6419568.1 hypothetical protein [Cytophagales bacterium]MCA6425160.1 hypothetical protein [Cytophagales bacterium]MCA6431816.1 hypothetical protein [Cytophagales bacterium]